MNADQLTLTLQRGDVGPTSGPVVRRVSVRVAASIIAWSWSLSVDGDMEILVPAGFTGTCNVELNNTQQRSSSNDNNSSSSSNVSNFTQALQFFNACVASFGAQPQGANVPVTNVAATQSQSSTAPHNASKKQISTCTQTSEHAAVHAGDDKRQQSSVPTQQLVSAQLSSVDTESLSSDTLKNKKRHHGRRGRGYRSEDDSPSLPLPRTPNDRRSAQQMPDVTIPQLLTGTRKATVLARSRAVAAQTLKCDISAIGDGRQQSTLHGVVVTCRQHLLQVAALVGMDVKSLPLKVATLTPSEPKTRQTDEQTKCCDALSIALQDVRAAFARLAARVRAEQSRDPSDSTLQADLLSRAVKSRFAALVNIAAILGLRVLPPKPDVVQQAGAAPTTDVLPKTDAAARQLNDDDDATLVPKQDAPVAETVSRTMFAAHKPAAGKSNTTAPPKLAHELPVEARDDVHTAPMETTHDSSPVNAVPPGDAPLLANTPATPSHRYVSAAATTEFTPFIPASRRFETFRQTGVADSMLDRAQLALIGAEVELTIAKTQQQHLSALPDIDRERVLSTKAETVIKLRQQAVLADATSAEATRVVVTLKLQARRRSDEQRAEFRRLASEHVQLQQQMTSDLAAAKDADEAEAQIRHAYWLETRHQITLHEMSAGCTRVDDASARITLMHKSLEAKTRIALKLHADLAATRNSLAQCEQRCIDLTRQRVADLDDWRHVADSTVSDVQRQKHALIAAIDQKIQEMDIMECDRSRNVAKIQLDSGAEIYSLGSSFSGVSVYVDDDLRAASFAYAQLRFDLIIAEQRIDDATEGVRDLSQDIEIDSKRMQELLRQSAMLLQGEDVPNATPQATTPRSFEPVDPPTCAKSIDDVIKPQATPSTKKQKHE